MMENSKPAAPPDVLTERLRASMQRDRGRFRRHLAALALLIVLACAAAIWWVVRQPSAPPLTVVAMDQVAVPEEETELVAWVEAVQGEPVPVYLGGLEVIFADLGGASPLRTRTQGTGQASVKRAFAGPANEASFLVRMLGKRQIGAAEDRARVVLLPRGTKLALVDVHELFQDPEIDFAQADINQVGVNPAKAKELQALRQKKTAIIYLALQSDRAADYRRARRWIQSKQVVLPPGPVLGRLVYHESIGAEEARRQIIKELSANYDVP